MSLGNAASSSAGRAYLLSLGCPKNEVDAQIIAALLGKHNWCLQDTPLGAELIIINTCAFIQEAKEESIAAILEAGKEKQSGSCRWLVVTGCFSQRYGVNLPKLLPEVDLFLGVNDIPHLGEHISSLVAGATGNEQKMDTPTFLMSARQSRMLSGQRHVAYLKIADGCNNHCSYCAIPQIRGVYRSRTIADTLLEAQELVRMGVKEVILAAQDTTLFGKDRRGAQENIGTLLRALARIEGVRWLRLLYTHPAHIDEELLAAIAQEAKVCKYIDLPIQHINDQILQSMNRRVTKKEIIAVLEKIRQAIPQVALRTSIIVGYPLETPKRFAELLAFVEAARFEHLGVFCYSRE
ncbi:MAG: MiaB/RimO family radical SAM methylthiotransferase, partial [Deltaproteobacteria bacterium]|nr:MiaB/RimO family radical SAM methylthiotransferase [Deltaproteobacteria bacterium]